MKFWLPFLTLVLAQNDCPNLNSCKSAAAAYQINTCDPLRLQSASDYQKCSCYQVVSLTNCYSSCQQNTELTLGILPNLPGQCAAAGLDWKNLPGNPSWGSAPDFAIVTAGGPSATAIATAGVGIATTTPKNSALSHYGSGMAAGLALLLASIQ